MKTMEIGGQALPYGIIMRNRDKISIAKREKNSIKEKLLYTTEAAGRRYELPIIRGVFLLWNFYNSLITSFKEPGTNKQKEERFRYSFLLILNLSAAIFIFLFFMLILPSLLAGIFELFSSKAFLLNIIESIMRLLLFIVYMKILMQFSELEILFKYHGAEHKTIHCYEAGETLSVENVRKFHRTHPRCGTNYIVYTFLVFLIINIFLGWPGAGIRIITRAFTILPAFIVGYEVFYYFDHSKHPFFRKINDVFSKIQFWTTLEPEDDMIEVGIRAIRPIIGELRMTGQDVIKKFGSVDGYLILEEVLVKSRTELKLNMPFELSREEEEKIIKISDLYDEIPLQYILGHWNFYGRDFKVRKNVLIPRFDTENLLETVIRWRSGYKDILDIGTGSGIIAITLGLELPEASVIGVDISEDAYRLAEENRKLLKAENVEFRLGDLFEPVSGEKFDLICSNPPYINSQDMETLDWKVKSEPSLALYGGEDGLDFYRRIISDAPKYLKPGGLLAFEIGSDQGKSVELFLQEEGFHEIKLFQDLQGFDRVILAVYQ